MKTILRNCGLSVVAVIGLTVASALATEFIYPGRLYLDATPTTGTYDLAFAVYDAPSSGNQLGAAATNNALFVNNGLFMGRMNLGISPITNELWLEIAVRTNGGSAFLTLNPRQSITPVPYAITASNLTGTLPAAQLIGSLPAGSLSGSYSEPVSLSNRNNSFAGSGSGLVGVNAATLGGLGPDKFWRIGGNTGTTASNFVGTLDNQILELRANDLPGLRLQPTYDGRSINFVAGNDVAAAATTIGATIGGGNSNRIMGAGAFIDHAPTISGGQDNELEASSFDTIAGGRRNKMFRHSVANVISGGEHNALLSDGVSYCVISGGQSNSMIASGGQLRTCTIGGGSGNRMSPGSEYARGSTIAGGENNVVSRNSYFVAIGGGSANAAVATAYGTISGGNNNTLGIPASDEPSIKPDYSFIGGGSGNFIPNGQYCSIVGGADNQISGSSHFGSIGGGTGNGIIDSGAFGLQGRSATIAGGESNIVSSDYATIGGGSGNSIPQGDYGTIAGGSRNQIDAYGGLAQSKFAAVGGGSENIITGAEHSIVAGGLSNRIMRVGGYHVDYSVIGGGNGNEIRATRGSTIGGGEKNLIASGCSGATIGGGVENSNHGFNTTIGGGQNNLIVGNCEVGPTNPFSTIGGGANNRIETGLGSFTISGGYNNVIEASRGNKGATIAGGESNAVTASYSTIPGGLQAKTSNLGQMAYASGAFAKPGDAQTSVYVCRGMTTNAAPAELFLDGISQRMSLPTNSTWALDILVTGRAADGTSAAYQLLAAAKNNVGITTLGAPRKQNILAEDAPAWDATVVALATDSTLSIQVTGSAGMPIRWVATVRSSEVTY
jgi:hypothetical protein